MEVLPKLAGSSDMTKMIDNIHSNLTLSNPARLIFNVAILCLASIIVFGWCISLFFLIFVASDANCFQKFDGYSPIFRLKFFFPHLVYTEIYDKKNLNSTDSKCSISLAIADITTQYMSRIKI